MVDVPCQQADSTPPRGGGLGRDVFGNFRDFLSDPPHFISLGLFVVLLV